MESIKIWAFAFAMLASITLASAQTKGVVWDKTNNIPVPFVNVYTTSNGMTLATASDAEGHFEVNFDFNQLTISHIEYKKMEISTLPDTIFLQPNTNILQEVVVTNQEPDWIRLMLRRLIKEKDTRYAAKSKVYDYEYETRNIEDSLGYWFESKGQLCLTPEKELHTIDPMIGIIHFKDTTAGCDFSNLKRMLYFDFVNELDKDFIKQHRFFVNTEYHCDNANVVEISFNSEKYKEDKGRFLVDTARCAILEAQRNMGRDYCIANYTQNFLRSAFKQLAGMEYKDWLVSNRFQYTEQNGYYYLKKGTYKIYQSIIYDRKEVAPKQFYSSEASVTLTTTEHQTSDTFLPLPPPHLPKFILTKKEQRQEEALQKISKKHILY